MLEKKMQMLYCQVRFPESEILRNYFCKAHQKVTQFILLSDNSFVRNKEPGFVE